MSMLSRKTSSIDVAACCGGYVDTARLLVDNRPDVNRMSIAKDNNSILSAVDYAMDDRRKK